VVFESFFEGPSRNDILRDVVPNWDSADEEGTPKVI